MPKTAQEILEETLTLKQSRGTTSVEVRPDVERPGLFSRALKQFDIGLGNIADTIQGIGLTDEEFAKIRALNPASVKKEIPRAETTGEKAVDLFRFAPEIGIEAAAIAGSGGVAAPAILARRSAASGVAGAIGGFSEAISDPTKSAAEIATDTAIAAGISAAAPVAFRGAGKALGLGARAADTGLGNILGSASRKSAKEILSEASSDTTATLVREGVHSAEPTVRRTSAELMQNLHDNLTKGSKLLSADDLAPEQLLRKEGAATFKSQLLASLRENVGEEAAKRVDTALTKVDQTAGPVVRKLVDDTMDGMSPEQAARFMDDVDGFGLGALGKNIDMKKVADGLFEFRAAAMLSSPLTLLRNFGSTISNQLLRRGSDFVAGGASLAKSKLTGKPQEVFIREAVAGAKGLIPERLAKLFGLNNSLPQELAEFAKTTKVTREVLSRETSAFGDNFIAKNIIGAPFRALSGSDNMLFNREFAAESYRQATNRALRANPKLKGAELGAAVQRFLQDKSTDGAQIRKFAMDKASQAVGKTEAEILDLANKMTRDLSGPGGIAPDLAETRTLAERAIFIARENKLLDTAIEGLKHADPLLNIYMPFRRTPANVARETLRATPLGFFKRWQGAVDTGMDPATARNFAFREVSRAATGTSLALGTMSLMKAGLIKANPFDRSESKAKRDVENAAGEFQDMVQLGDWQFQARNLGDYGKVILSLQEGIDRVDAGEQSEGRAFIESITKDLVQRVGDDTFTSAVTDIISTIQSDDDSKWRRFAEQFGGSFVPAFVREGQKITESTIREPVVNEEGVPFLDPVVAGARARLGDTLGEGEDKLGLFGEVRKQGVIGNDPTAKEMLRVGAFHQAPTTITGVELNPSDDTNFRKAKGQLQRQEIEKVIRSGNYSKLPLEVQKKRIKAAYSRASKKANARGRRMAAMGIPINTRAIVTGKLR